MISVISEYEALYIVIVFKSFVRYGGIKNEQIRVRVENMKSKIVNLSNK